MTDITHIIFDCDGVLVDSEILSVRAYVETYARHGLRITKADVAACFGMKQTDIFTRIGAMTGQHFPMEKDGELSGAITRLLQAELKPVSGIAALLETLPLPRAVASSSKPERISLSLGLTGLAGFFGQHVYSSTMVSHGKPAPDLFLLAAERLGAAPATCAVFEDSTYGIMAARAAGMQAFGFLGGSHLTQSHRARLAEAGAHRVYDDWGQVAADFGLDIGR